MRIGGLGTWATSMTDAPGCPTNPCTWVDNLYVRDECLEFMKCAHPNDWWTIANDKGLLVGSGAAVGQAAGSTVSEMVGGFGDKLAGDTGIPGWVMILGVTLGGLFLIKEFR